LRSVYVKTVVLVLLIALLATDGYLAYRYYERLAVVRSGPAVPAAPAEHAEAQEATKEQTDKQEPETAFVHRAAARNIVDNSTYIDNPLTNGNPDALLLVTQVREPDGDNVNNARPIGVWYDANRDGKWAIFNQDRAQMPDGAAFNVVVLQASEDAAATDGYSFVHRASPDNTVGDSTYVDRPVANGNPDLVVSVTPNWNPGGGSGTYDNHPVGLRYDAGRERWAIFNQDRAQMPDGAAFNVMISEAAGTSG